MKAALAAALLAALILAAAAPALAKTILLATNADGWSILHQWDFSSPEQAENFTVYALVNGSWQQGTGTLQVQDGALIVNETRAAALPTASNPYSIVGEGSIVVAWIDANGSVVASVSGSPSLAVTLLPLPSGETIVYAEGAKAYYNTSTATAIIVYAGSGQARILRVTQYAPMAAQLSNPPDPPYNDYDETNTVEKTITLDAGQGKKITKWWFWDRHGSNEDVDAFLFKETNQHYSEASNSETWNWLASYADDKLYADGQAAQHTIQNPTRKAKIVVKAYPGKQVGQWRLAAKYESGGDNPAGPLPASGKWKYALLGAGAIIILAILVMAQPHGAGRRRGIAILSPMLLLILLLLGGTTALAVFRPEYLLYALLGLGAILVIAALALGRRRG